MEYITDADYTHAKNVYKDLAIKKLGEYQNLYVQSDVLLLADYWRTLEISVLKYMNLIPQKLFKILQKLISTATSFKKDKMKTRYFN